MSNVVFVVFSYTSKAALRTDWKLDEEEDVVGALWDMELIRSDQFDRKTMRGRRERTGMRYCLVV